MSNRRFTSPRGKKLTGLARKYPLDRATSVAQDGPARDTLPVRLGNILLAAPTPECVAGTGAALIAAGYRLATVLGADEALHVMARECFDLLILGSSGYDSVTQRLRRIRGHDTIECMATDSTSVGILVVMERHTAGWGVRRRAALSEGADDVLLAPFSTRELLLRVATLLRRIARTPSPTRESLTLGDLHVDIAAHQVVVGQRVVELTPAEFTMLRTLAERPGQLCSRAILARTERANTRGVDMRISRIRRKLGTDAVIIECIRGKGYRIARTAAS